MPDFLLMPVQTVLDGVATGVARRQPSLFERLGRHTRTTFLIDPTNLPIVLLLTPEPPRPRLRACWRAKAGPADCRIAGTFATLLALVDGRRDGDATFFSRDLTVEGDIDAVVTLRNALDDLDVTLTEDILNGAGLLRRPMVAVVEFFRALDRREGRHVH